MEEKKLVDVSEPVGQSIIKGVITGGLWAPLTIKQYREVARDEFDKLGINDNFIFRIFCLFGLGSLICILGCALGSTAVTAGAETAKRLKVTEKQLEKNLENFDKLGVTLCEGNALRYLAYIGAIILIGALVMCILAAVKMENLIKEQAAKNGIENYRINKALLIIFHIYYVNYCLEDIKGRKK